VVLSKDYFLVLIILDCNRINDIRPLCRMAIKRMDFLRLDKMNIEDRNILMANFGNAFDVN
jgi:hypothetical protein